MAFAGCPRGIPRCSGTGRASRIDKTRCAYCIWWMVCRCRLRVFDNQGNRSPVLRVAARAARRGAFRHRGWCLVWPRGANRHNDRRERRSRVREKPVVGEFAVPSRYWDDGLYAVDDPATGRVAIVVGTGHGDGDRSGRRRFGRGTLGHSATFGSYGLQRSGVDVKRLG